MSQKLADRRSPGSLAASASPTPAASTVDTLLSRFSRHPRCAHLCVPARNNHHVNFCPIASRICGAHPRHAASPATALATAFESTVRLTPTAAISSVSFPSPAAAASSALRPAAAAAASSVSRPAAAAAAVFSPPTRKRLVVRTDLLAAHSVRPRVSVCRTQTPSLCTARSCAESVRRCLSATLPHAMPMCQTRVPDPV